MKAIYAELVTSFLRSRCGFLVSMLLLCSGRATYSMTYTWNAGNGDWDASINWSPIGVPGGSDTAILGSGTYTVTVDSVQTVGALDMTGNSGTQTLNIAEGGTLTINNASSGSANAIMVIDGGTLAGPGNLALAGPVQWSYGTITNMGVSFSGGSFGVSDDFLNDAMLTNSGVLYWTNGGSLLDGNNSFFTNLPAATIIVSNTSDFVYGGYFPSGTHVFGNGGTIVVEGGGIQAMYTENFVNSGEINITGSTTFQLYSGTLQDSGSVLMDPTATFEVSGTPTDTFTAASSISGDASPPGGPGGNLLVSGGTVIMNGSLQQLSGSWTFSGGTTTVTGPDSRLLGALTVSGGAVSFESSGSIGIANLTVSQGTLAGPQNLVAGVFNWSGGTITNTGVWFGGGSFSAGDLLLSDTWMTNDGVLYWTNGGILLDGNNSFFTNVPEGTIIVSNASDFFYGGYYPSGTHVFGNGGTMIVEGSGSQEMYYENFVNSGTLDVNGGTLQLYEGTNEDTGPVNVASGATLNLDGADTFTPASSISGQGNLLVGDGTANLNSGLALTGSWTFSGGTATINGPDSVIFNTITVSGGTVNFNGSGTIAPDILAVSEGTLAGPQELIAGNLDWSGGTITNTGVYCDGGSFSSGEFYLEAAAITNIGTLYWTNGAEMLDGDGSILINASSGGIVVSNDSAFLYGGYFSGSHSFVNQGAITLFGPGNQVMATENFVNSGVVNIYGGTLSFSQCTNTLANGILNFGISSLANYGSVSFSGPADLSGTLTATILNQSFVPAADDEWPVITYGSIVGNFSTISLPPIGDWEEIVNPADYIIEITQTAPAPFFTQNLAQTNYALAGAPALMSVEEGGTPPFTNQWFYEANGITNAVQNGGRISGATTTNLTIAYAQTNDDGPYQLFVTNGFAPYFDVSGVGQLVVEEEPLFNGNGSLWTLNGGAAIQNNVLTLTDGQQDEARSAFYYVPVYYPAFRASFTYQSAQGTTSTKADGVTFCLQNTTAGPGAVGSGGGSLGYKGITNSLAIAIDQFTAKGIEWLTNGADPANPAHYTVTAPAVDPSSGDPINVSILFQTNTIFLAMTDAVTLGTFVTNFALNLPVTGTNQAFVGFTGGDGDEDSVQTISNFSFVPLPSIAAKNFGVNVLLSWPTGTGGYQLQSTTNLITGPWVIVPVSYYEAAQGALYEITVPPQGNEFYRLMLPAN